MKAYHDFKVNAAVTQSLKVLVLVVLLDVEEFVANAVLEEAML